MIELILTNTLDSAPILGRLKSRIGKTKKHILFVPDRFSLSYQKAVLEYLDIKGTFDIEVSSFPRLANKLLQNKKRLLDKQAEIMLLRKVIDDSKDCLHCFGRIGKNADFANDMYAAISQIRNSNISVERMQEVADKLPKRIADKTKDIAKIYHDYIKYIQDGYADGTSKLQALCDLIYDGALNDCEVYISDFTSFSDVEYEIIKAIMSNAPSVHICLVDSDEENKHVFPKEVYKRLASLSQEVGVAPDINYVGETLSGDADIIYRGLYSYVKVDGNRDNRTDVIACKDIDGEIKTLARNILRLVKEENARYSDIAVVCCDFEAYMPTLKNVFDSFSIPFYADVQQPLSSQALTKYLTSAMRAAGDKYSQASVLEFVKEGILGIDCEKLCAFDNYCCKYAIEYTRFCSAFTIGDLDGREAAEEVRKKVIDTLDVLKTDGKTVSEHIKSVRNFLQADGVAEAVEELAKWQSDNNYASFSSITLQSPKKLNAILDQCEAMLGSSVESWDDFCAVLNTAIESVRLSNIPLYSDSVFVGETSQNRYANLDYMFVIGATAGKFPPEHVDKGIVSEREYVAWSAMGIDVQPDCRRRNGRERLGVLMMLTRARKSLCISYPTSSTDGSQVMPSSTVEYICDLLDISPACQPRPDEGWDIVEYARYVGTQDNLLQEFLALNFAFDSGEVSVCKELRYALDVMYGAVCEKYGKDYIDALIRGEEDETQLDGVGDVMFNGSHTSVSQFEKYFKCPFLHFNENVLKLQRKEIAGLEVKDTGILLHAVMERYFSLKDCADYDEAKIERTVSDIFIDEVKKNSDYSFLLDEKTHALTLRQLVDQAVYVVKNLVRNMQVTKYRPYLLEAAFGNRPDAKISGMEISTGSRRLNFTGVIDRIDRYGDRAIIIDYKSKSKIDFSPSNILYGDRIQLFIYLNALRASGLITPQGVFYLLMNNRFVKGGEKVEKRYMFNGFVNAEELDDLDEGFANSQTFASAVYPIKRKDDSVTAQKQGVLLTGKEFDGVCDYVMRLTTKAAQEIEDGYIAKSPLNINGAEEVKACKYCDYHAICRRHTKYVRNVKDATMDSLRDAFDAKEEISQPLLAKNDVDKEGE